MDFVTIFLSIILAVFLYYYFNKENYFDKHGINYVKPYPFIGNMAAVLLQQISLVDFLQRIYNLHRDAKYVGFFDISCPTIVIHDLKIAKDITIKYFDHFVNHRGFTDPIVEPLVGNNLFLLHNNEWRKMRSLLSPSFTSSKMKGMFILMSECAENFANYFAEKSENKSYEVNSRDAFLRYSIDVTGTCAYGIEIDSLRDPNNRFYILARDVATFDGIVTMKIFFSRSFPKISRLLNIKLFPADTEKFFTELVENTIASRDEKGISRPDMLQLMMETRNAENGSRRALTIQEMTAHAFSFFLAGVEASSTLLAYVTYFLAAHEDIQIKLQIEVDDVFGKCDGDLSYEAINNMVYLDAVIKEALRMFPINPLLDRVCTVPFELPPATPGKKPVILKPGDCVWIPVYSLHRDPKYYENPDVFNPERFIKNGILSMDPTLPYIPFGQGPRRCIGGRFASLKIKILLVYLLHKVSIKPSEKLITPLKFSPSSFTLITKGQFWVEFERRKKKESRGINF